MPSPGLLHQLFIAGDVHGHAPLFGHDAGEIDGEAVGVVEFEGVLSRNLRLALIESHDPCVISLLTAFLRISSRVLHDNVVIERVLLLTVCKNPCSGTTQHCGLRGVLFDTNKLFNNCGEAASSKRLIPRSSVLPKLTSSSL